MDYLPIFLDVADRPVLLVGAGDAAARKVRLIRKAGGAVRVVAPEACEEVRELADSGALEWRRRAFRADDVEGAAAVYAATGDEAIDRAVSEAAQAAGIPVNAVDRPDLSTFITPALVDRAPVIVAVGSAGTAPVLARNVRLKIEAMLPRRLGRLASFADNFRGAVKAMIPEPLARLRFWDRFFDGPIADAVLAGDEGRAREGMLQAVNRAGSNGVEPGRVYIVGAGPGDPELLTLRAAKLLQQADAIVYDDLVDPEVLELARRDADRLYVGKRRGRHSHSQDEINRLLVGHAQAGRRVVRLKGGDPFVFGRGGEELDALRAAGIAAEVVPGITAASGCAAASGMPLTHREHASAVTFLTGRGSGGEPDVDWRAFAHPRHTLAVYMGVHAAPRIAERLIEAGRAPATPVAVIENGTRRDERILTTTLTDLAAAIARDGIAGPALIVVGEVARYAERRGFVEELSERVG